MPDQLDSTPAAKYRVTETFVCEDGYTHVVKQKPTQSMARALHQALMSLLRHEAGGASHSVTIEALHD